MTEPFDSLITKKRELMELLSNNSSALCDLLKPDELKDQAGKILTPSVKLNEIISDFTTQSICTKGTFTLLPSKGTIEELKIATNLVQIYSERTQSLKQILLDLPASLPSTLPPNNTQKIQDTIKKIEIDLDRLQGTQKDALQELGKASKKPDLTKLSQMSDLIKTNFKNLSASPIQANFLDEIQNLINNLISAGEFFKNFGENNENLNDPETEQIKKLISDWGESIALIEMLEQTDSIRTYLIDPINSRFAIAQSIEIHNLLENNYDYLTAIVRSVDLVSAGSL